MDTSSLFPIVLMALVIAFIFFMAYFANKIARKDFELRSMRMELDKYRENTEIIAKNLAGDFIKDAVEKTRADERKITQEREHKLREDLERTKINEIAILKQTWEAEKKREIDDLIKQTRKDTTNRSRAVLKGKIGEQMAPLLEEFYSKYDLSDARFIGEPVDYIIFHNLTKYKDEIKRRIPPEERSLIEIVIADIKTGKSQLNTEQRRIRDAIFEHRIRWDEIRIAIPEESSDESPAIGISAGSMSRGSLRNHFNPMIEHPVPKKRIVKKIVKKITH